MTWYVRFRTPDGPEVYRVDAPADAEPAAVLRDAQSGVPVSYAEYMRDVVLTTNLTYIGNHCVTWLDDPDPKPPEPEPPEAVQLGLLETR
jgi:hypothetical protein